MTRSHAGFSRHTVGALLAVALLVTCGSASAAAKKPTIHNFLPRTGSIGTTITITGTNYSAVTAVRIAGLKVAYKVRSSTRITATVPAGGKSGKVSVTTKGGTATSTGALGVYAPNGSGTLSSAVTSVSPGSTGDVLGFTYTAASGGISGGAVAIEVPTGWTAPVATNAAGCTTASAGTVSTSGQTITVSGLTLAAGATATITYGAVSGGACTANDGATAATAGGSAVWQALEKSFAGGVLTNLAASPSVNVLAANGAGTMTTPVTSVGPGETGDIIVFTYTAGSGGMTSGVVTLAVPSGWSAPVTTNAVGCTTSSAGTVSTSGQTITVSGLTLAAAATATITYGANSGGSCGVGDGVKPSSTAGSVAFTTEQSSSATGSLAPIASSPSITVT
jgi:hypothetical protein